MFHFVHISLLISQNTTGKQTDITRYYLHTNRQALCSLCYMSRQSKRQPKRSTGIRQKEEAVLASHTRDGWTHQQLSWIHVFRKHYRKCLSIKNFKEDNVNI